MLLICEGPYRMDATSSFRSLDACCQFLEVLVWMLLVPRGRQMDDADSWRSQDGCRSFLEVLAWVLLPPGGLGMDAADSGKP